MIRLALRELLVRRAATAAMALGLITATVGFVVLAGTSETTQAVLTRDIAKAWPAPYDILVRPVGTQDQVEANAGLVRPNYLSGLRGGITTAQLDQVGATPGVAVAAPIAIVGFTYWPALRWIDLGPYIEPDKISFFRLSVVSRGDAGRSIYPSETMYIVASATGRVVPDWDRSKQSPAPRPWRSRATSRRDPASTGAACRRSVSLPRAAWVLGPRLLCNAARSCPIDQAGSAFLSTTRCRFSSPPSIPRPRRLSLASIIASLRAAIYARTTLQASSGRRLRPYLPPGVLYTDRPHGRLQRPRGAHVGWRRSPAHKIVGFIYEQPAPGHDYPRGREVLRQPGR